MQGLAELEAQVEDHDAEQEFDDSSDSEIPEVSELQLKRPAEHEETADSAKKPKLNS